MNYKADFSHVDEKLKKLEGPGWRLCYPRRYVPPMGYANPKYASAFISSQLKDALVTPDRKFGKVQVDCILASYKLVEYMVPTFFVGNDFISELVETEPPHDMLLGELQWPFPAMTFVLPEAFQSAYFGRPVPFLNVAQVHGGANDAPECLTRFHDFPAMGFDGTDNVLIATASVSFRDKFLDYAASFPDSDTIGSCITQAEFAGPEGVLPFIDPDIQTTHEEDMALATKIFSLAVWLLLGMMAAPEHVERASLIRPARVKRGRVVKDELWTPNFIGRQWYVKREYQGGSHASPKFHRRRGHMRWTPVGKGRTQRELRWVKWCFVGVREVERQMQ